MPSWSEVEQDAPDFALRVRGRFDAGTNKTLASPRRDGAPRIRASETEFSSDGEVILGTETVIKTVEDENWRARCNFCRKRRGQVEGMASAASAVICVDYLSEVREIVAENL